MCFLLLPLQDDAYGRSVNSVNNENRLKHLRKEVELLRQKVSQGADGWLGMGLTRCLTSMQLEKDREKLRRGQGSEPPIVPPPDFPINAKFSLDPEVSAYVLNIEIQVSG